MNVEDGLTPFEDYARAVGLFERKFLALFEEVLAAGRRVNGETCISPERLEPLRPLARVVLEGALPPEDFVARAAAAGVEVSTPHVYELVLRRAAFVEDPESFASVFACRKANRDGIFSVPRGAA